MRSPPDTLFLMRTTLLLFAALCTAAAQDVTGLPEIPEFKPLKYRSIGPAWGGRVSRAVGVPGDPSTYYFAGAMSGVWKSTDGGHTWRAIFDDQPTSSIGAIALAPSDPNTIYVGSGEANFRGNAAEGAGIFKSTDAGKTWTHVWKQAGQIGTIVVHPANPDVAYAAVLGKPWGPNPERGVYRTKDGGKTWQQVLKKDENAGASDVALDPSNPNVIFAGFWEMRRYPWDLKSGGPGSGLYVSKDGGDTWKQLTEKGLPKGIWGKVGVAVAPSDSRRVYALIEGDEGGLFRSNDGGDNWTRITDHRALRQRAWYYSTMTVHPVKEDEVWFPQVPMVKTIDGGKTVTYVRGFAHGDHHDIWFDPKNPKRMINANDGGVEISLNGGETWFQPALPIAQFYHVSADNRVPFSVAGAMQDIGTAQGPSDSLSRGGIRNGEWYGVGGGEAGWVVSDPSDPNIVYAGEYGGIMTHYDHRTRQARNVTAYPENPSGHGGEDLKYRFQWTAPIHLSPHNPKVIYHGSNVVHRSTDAGLTWTNISGDLTRNDKSKQKWAGGPITGDNTGVEIYCTVFVIAESPLQKDLIWAGSDDGLVHVTRDGGKSWKNVTMKGFPDWATISMIEPSRFDAGTAYVVVDGHRVDDPQPYLYKTTDFGASWTRLDGGLARGVYLHAVREDPVKRDILYLGTERGVAITFDGGKSWKSLRLNLPTVAVHDLAVKDNSLVLATMGRSLWILDHLSAVREFGAFAEPVKLLSAPDTIAWRRDRRPADRFSGENPAAGASLYYYLKEKPKGDLEIEIRDAQNGLVAKLSSKAKEPSGAADNLEMEREALRRSALPVEPGINRAVWGLTYEGAELIPNGKIDLGSAAAGPLVLPGAYTVRLTVDGTTQTASLQVTRDPRVTLSDTEARAQTATALTVRDSVTQVTRIVKSVRTIRKQLADRNELVKGNPRAEQLAKDSAALIAKLDELEGKLHNRQAQVVYDILAAQGGTKLYSRLVYVYDTILDGDGAVTQGVREVYADQKKELDQYDREFKRLADAELTSLNLAAKRLELPVVVLPEIK